MNQSQLFGTVALLTLSACNLPEPPAGSDILSDRARGGIPGSWGGSHHGGQVVPDWIRSFGDPELTRLAGDAVVRNPDLRAAAAKVEASRAAVRVAAGGLYPRAGVKLLGEEQGQNFKGDLNTGIDPPDLGGTGVDNSGGAGNDTSVDPSTRRTVYGLGLGASWEADVWGRVRSKKAAAQADSDALQADYDFARQSLVAAVARAYFTTIEASQQAANAEEAMGFYQEDLWLTGIRKEQGYASDFDVAQIKSRIAAGKNALYVAQAARAQSIRAIEVVTSHYPAGKLEARRTFPNQPKAVPSGLPAQILERRPDLIAAERRFAAAFHRVNEARTARLPRFALSLNSGVGSADLNGVGTLNAFTWSLASGVTQPIFFSGELKAAQDIRTSEQKAAAASYTGTALRAFEDVEDALAGEFYLNAREGALRDLVESSDDAARLGRLQLDQGQIDMFSILGLAGASLDAKVELTKIQASRLRERVNLHLALGGNFKGTSGK